MLRLSQNGENGELKEANHDSYMWRCYDEIHKELCAKQLLFL